MDRRFSYEVGLWTKARAVVAGTFLMSALFGACKATDSQNTGQAAKSLIEQLNSRSHLYRLELGDQDVVGSIGTLIVSGPCLAKLELVTGESHDLQVTTSGGKTINVAKIADNGRFEPLTPTESSDEIVGSICTSTQSIRP